MADKCPVDHAQWDKASATLSPLQQADKKALSEQRQVSSIPRSDGTNWVYPSESQFFAAMARKNYNPRKEDMQTVVPIHNIVNERTWKLLYEWEEGRGGDKCGGIKLVSFKGRPNELSIRARFKVLMG
jgi:cytochrome c heme-lyase